MLNYLIFLVLNMPFSFGHTHLKVRNHSLNTVHVCPPRRMNNDDDAPSHIHPLRLRHEHALNLLYWRRQWPGCCPLLSYWCITFASVRWCAGSLRSPSLSTWRRNRRPISRGSLVSWLPSVWSTSHECIKGNVSGQIKWPDYYKSPYQPTPQGTPDCHISCQSTPCTAERPPTSHQERTQSVSTAPTVMTPLNISYYIADCTTTSDPDYCQLNQIYTTRYMDPQDNCNEQPPTTCQPWTDVTRLSEVWGTKKGKGKNYKS